MTLPIGTLCLSLPLPKAGQAWTPPAPPVARPAPSRPVEMVAPPVAKDTPCPHCGGPVVRNDRRRRRYCSPECAHCWPACARHKAQRQAMAAAGLPVKGRAALAEEP